MSNAAPRRWSLTSPTRRRALIQAECAAAAERRIRYAAFRWRAFQAPASNLAPAIRRRGFFRACRHRALCSANYGSTAVAATENERISDYLYRSRRRAYRDAHLLIPPDAR
jgi:hypothetical protein